MSLALSLARPHLGGKRTQAVFLAIGLVIALVGSARPAHAAVADLLILSTTITKPAADGNPLSVEEQEAAALGLTVDIATPVQWAAMTTAQFAAYKALILGDPTCQGGGTANPNTAAALANKSVWGPAVNGNITIYGTDPTFHTEFGPFVGPRQVVHSSIAFAASSGPGKTGAYVTLSCYYHGTAPGTPVPLLDAFETVPGQFTVTGVGCFNNAHIVATSSALNGLTDANLSNWSCSVHEAFDRWASDFTVLVIALTGTSYTAPDGSVGTPYVLARGNISAGDIALSPPSQTVCTGGSATVTAKVTSGGAPQSGVTVTFTITSGPNAGMTFTGTTDASGQVSFTYSGTVAGTDTITASFTDRSGHTQTSRPVTVTWTVCDQPIAAQPVTFAATEGQTFSGPVATFTDPDTTATAAEYSATIDWGDSTPTTTGTISGPTGGPFTVSGTHMYAEEGTVSPVTVTITDIDNPSNTAQAFSTANVGDAPLTSRCPTPGGTMPPISLNPFAGATAIFNDSSSTGTLSDFSATIDWGDATSSTGTITGGPGLAPYTVSGTHTYGSTGTFSVTTTVKDVGGQSTFVVCQVIIFAFATEKGAAFVIGDKEAGLGNHVTWWSSQWANINLMSGGAPPDAMKGFAGFEDNFLGLPPPNCGGTWSTDPGNSTPPPPSVPKTMGVIVSSKVTQSGSVITGDIKQVVIVDNDPGYGPSPGHDGTGKEIAILCMLP